VLSIAFASKVARAEWCVGSLDAASAADARRSRRRRRECGRTHGSRGRPSPCGGVSLKLLERRSSRQRVTPAIHPSRQHSSASLKYASRYTWSKPPAAAKPKLSRLRHIHAADLKPTSRGERFSGESGSSPPANEPPRKGADLDETARTASFCMAPRRCASRARRNVVQIRGPQSARLMPACRNAKNARDGRRGGFTEIGRCCDAPAALPSVEPSGGGTADTRSRRRTPVDAVTSAKCLRSAPKPPDMPNGSPTS
jgi:hypothetical protein